MSALIISHINNKRILSHMTQTIVYRTRQFVCRHRSTLLCCTQQNQHSAGVVLPSILVNSYHYETRRKYRYTKCDNRLYSTNGQGSTSSTLTIENMFDDWNKKRVKERLLTVKPVTRPTQFAVNPRKAAVLVPLCTVNGEPSFLYMMRSLHLNNHAGEICFPGGMQDKGDDSLVATALRETHEETGLDTSTVDIWGSGAPLPSRKGHMVTPIIGFCGEVDVNRLTPNKDEVDSVFTMPVSSFLQADNQRQTQFRYPGSEGYTLPVFRGGEYTIWGLTAILTHQIMTIIAPELYNYKLKHRR